MRYFLPGVRIEGVGGKCNGENLAGCTPTLSIIKELDLEKSTWEEYSHADLLEEPWSDHQVFKLCKGIYSHLIGGILHYAYWWEGQGKALEIEGPKVEQQTHQLEAIRAH